MIPLASTAPQGGTALEALPYSKEKKQMAAKLLKAEAHHDLLAFMSIFIVLRCVRYYSIHPTRYVCVDHSS